MAKKITAYIKLQVKAAQANQAHLLVLHWVSTA
jgi:ribosomal protein L11